MAIRDIVTRGYGNGTYDPGVSSVVVRGYTIGGTGGTFDDKAVHSSLLKHFDDNFNASSSLTYDNMPFDWDAATEAVDVVVETFDSPVRRKGNKIETQVQVTVNCWAKRGTNLWRGHELADAVAAVLKHAEVTVKDYDAAGDPTVGYCRLREPMLIDMTRENEDDTRVDLQHLTVICRGRSQES